MNGYWMCYINDGNKVKCYKYHRITKKWNKCFKIGIRCYWNPQIFRTV